MIRLLLIVSAQNTHPLNGTFASNIVHRMTHSALFLNDQTQIKYVKVEIQNLAPFSHLTLISVTFDGFFREKIRE